MGRLDLSYYGLPSNYKEHLENFVSHPEIVSLYEKITAQPLPPKKIIEEYAEKGYLGYVLLYAAIKDNLSLLIPIVYSLTAEQRKYVHADWVIEHPQFDLTASNAFFIAYFQELYRETPDVLGRKMSVKGVALRALAHISYLPWVNFFYPVTDETIDHFLKMPLFDRDKSTLFSLEETEN